MSNKFKNYVVVHSEDLEVLKNWAKELEGVGYTNNTRIKTIGHEESYTWIASYPESRELCYHRHACIGNPLRFELPAQWDEALKAVSEKELEAIQ